MSALDDQPDVAGLRRAAIAFTEVWAQWLAASARADFDAAERLWPAVVEAERVHHEAAVRFAMPPARKTRPHLVSPTGGESA